ncbi:MAG: hypothetical protein KH268_02195 [Clostridiales bacterium]|mgnify:CR=1 FL=1|nr:hypothetical protein [Clostridiales bacterium]
MSNREYAHQLLDKIPESKIIYIVGILEGAAIPEIEEAEPDEWDLAMIAKAKQENDGETVTFDELMKKEGLTYADLQD